MRPNAGVPNDFNLDNGVQKSPLFLFVPRFSDFCVSLSNLKAKEKAVETRLK
jgi:hypothetical protein